MDQKMERLQELNDEAPAGHMVSYVPDDSSPHFVLSDENDHEVRYIEQGLGSNGWVVSVPPGSDGEWFSSWQFAKDVFLGKEATPFIG